MSTNHWLRRQIARLEEEIRTSSVFDDQSPASAEQLADLRERIVLRVYLKQQLLRRETLGDRDTKEYEVIPLPVEVESRTG